VNTRHEARESARVRIRQKVRAWEGAATGCEKEEGKRGGDGLREGVGEREKASAREGKCESWITREKRVPE